MRRWGTIALMLFAFVVGFASTYSCNGGSSAGADGDADTLQGHPAADFAYSTHPHTAGDISGGVLNISLMPSHSHAEYALTNHPHSEYADSNHSHDEYMDAVDSCSNNQVLKWSGSAWVCADDIDTINTDADTLDGLDSADFADSSHSHPGLPTGVHWIGAAECQGTNISARSTVAASSVPASAYCPISIPFKCTITEVQFKAKDLSDISNMVFEVHDGLFDIGLDENVPIASVDTSGWTSTTAYEPFSTGTVSLPYDPTNFDYDQPWWIRMYFNAAVPDQRVRWVRIYYTIP